MTRKLELAAIALSTIALGIAFYLLSSPFGLTVVILAGLGGMFASYRSKPAYASYSLGLAILLTFLAANAGTTPVLMLFSITLSLAAWDLSRFSTQLLKIRPPEAAARLEKLHLKRLALALGSGLVVGLIAVLIHIQLNLILALILGLLVFIGLSYVIRSLTNATPKVE
jgi:hypothetical protein